MSDDPEALVQSVIGDAASLSTDNIIIVIEKAKEQGIVLEVGDYLSGKRPDLADQIEEAMDDALAQF